MNKILQVIDVVKVESLKVACDGDGGTLGHPCVFLTIKPEVCEVVCPYCSRHYVLEHSPFLSVSY